MTLSDYLDLFRRQWFVVAGLALIGIMVAYALTSSMPTIYRAQATVLVTATSAEGVASSTDLQRVETFASLATTTVILDPAAATVGDATATLREAVYAVPRSNTSIIDINGSAGDAETAARRANAVADSLINLGTQVSGSEGTIALARVSSATPPRLADSPRPKNNIAIGALIGFALGISSILIASSLDSRIRRVTDLPRGRRFASVTTLPLVRGRSQSRISERVESFRQLRANLQFGDASSGAIAIAPVNDSVNAAAIAEQLSKALGEIGTRVALVTADFRDRKRPQKRDMVSMPGAGLADVLTGQADLLTVISPGPDRGVDVLGVGNFTPESSQVISTTAMAETLDKLANTYDYVLVVCPPVIERSETTVVAALAGHCLLVMEAESTQLPELEKALELLSGVGVVRPNIALEHVRPRALLHPYLSTSAGASDA